MSAPRARVAVDTSVLIPALAAWHASHLAARSVLAAGGVTIPVHVLLECYSVLTSLPSPHRIPAAVAATVIRNLESEVVGLPPAEQREVVATLGSAGIRGGAVYDGLVAAVAKSHGLTLVTADRRARPTYDAVGVTYRIL